MYLNLDLLYNIDKYIYPLFYYAYSYCCTLYVYAVYSPTTKKSVYIYPSYSICYDFITKKRNCQKDVIFDYTHDIYTENTINYSGFILEKCKPFKLTKENLYFLKSNTRIN